MQLSDILQSRQFQSIGAFLNKDISINKAQSPEYLTTISIDTQRSVFHFYSQIGDEGSEIKHYIKGYTSVQFNDMFFQEFRGAIAEFIANMPTDSIRKVAVVLPDAVVLTDTIKIPTLKGIGQTSKTLESTLSGLYRNYKDLHVMARVIDQNKTFTTFGVVAVKTSIISAVYAACLENRLTITAITYSSNALASGATMVFPKLKNASYLFMDIKGVYTRFTFVVKGKAVGFYTVPFGREFLRKNKLTQEDMLFDHSYAELMVLTAREAAKAKKPKDAEEADAFADVEDDEDWDEDFETVEVSQDVELPDNDPQAVVDAEADAVEQIIEGSTAATDESTSTIDEEEKDEEEYHGIHLDPAQLAKKPPRQLPKFMLRPVPTTKEGIAYENFRILVKWALTLIQENEKITSAGKPEFVCVNIPRDLMHVLEPTNAEAETNKIAFVPLPREGRTASVLANLELYAGFFPRQILPFGKF